MLNVKDKGKLETASARKSKNQLLLIQLCEKRHSSPVIFRSIKQYHLLVRPLPPVSISHTHLTYLSMVKCSAARRWKIGSVATAISA